MHVICFNMFTPVLCNLTSSGPLLPRNTPHSFIHVYKRATESDWGC